MANPSTSPGGAADFAASDAPPGLGSRCNVNPGLTPGATLSRRSAAGRIRYRNYETPYLAAAQKLIHILPGVKAVIPLAKCFVFDEMELAHFGF